MYEREDIKLRAAWKQLDEGFNLPGGTEVSGRPGRGLPSIDMVDKRAKEKERERLAAKLAKSGQATPSGKIGVLPEGVVDEELILDLDSLVFNSKPKEIKGSRVEDSEPADPSVGIFEASYILTYDASADITFNVLDGNNKVVNMSEPIKMERFISNIYDDAGFTDNLVDLIIDDLPESGLTKNPNRKNPNGIKVGKVEATSEGKVHMVVILSVTTTEAPEGDYSEPDDFHDYKYDDRLDESIDESLKLLRVIQEKKGPCWTGYKQIGMKDKGGKEVPNCVPVSESPAWQRKEGKNPEGGLNAKGRASAKKQGHDLKAPVSAKQAKKSEKSAARRKSFCARMKGMKKKLTGSDKKNDPDSRINKSLRKWDC
jgi:hypothetical protein